MGCYINPGVKKDDVFPIASTDAKLEWLKKYATRFPIVLWNLVPKGYLPICFVDNTTFTALFVAYNEREFNRAFVKGDSRPKYWFIAPIVDIREVSPLDQMKDFNA